MKAQHMLEILLEYSIIANDMHMILRYYKSSVVWAVRVYFFSRFMCLANICVVVQMVFAGEQPLFQQDIGAVSLFCENVRQVLAEIGRSVVRHSCKGKQGGALSFVNTVYRCIYRCIYIEFKIILNHGLLGPYSNSNRR